MLVRQLFEAKVTEKQVYIALWQVEKEIPREARWKSVEVSMKENTVYWVTQEMEDPDELLETAEKISELLLKKKVGLWKVSMCIRDIFQGFNNSTEWVTYDTV
jgi:hypothetical protein